MSTFKVGRERKHSAPVPTVSPKDMKVFIGGVELEEATEINAQIAADARKEKNEARRARSSQFGRDAFDGRAMALRHKEAA